MTKTRRARLQLSIPEPLRVWLDEQADANCTPINAEIVRSVKERREKLAAELTAMTNALGLADMSPSELRNYNHAIEERMLESGDPFQAKLVHAARRARERKQSGDMRPFGKLWSEEMGEEAK